MNVTINGKVWRVTDWYDVLFVYAVSIRNWNRALEEVERIES